MMKDLSMYGVEGFKTYKIGDFSSIRPCATSYDNDEAIKETIREHNEIKIRQEVQFPTILQFPSLTKQTFIKPIHLHPFMWQKRTFNDVDWYNRTNVDYVKFFKYGTNKEVYIPKEVSLEHECKGLSWCSFDGYGFDKDLELAKLKSLMELIEKDVVTLWWHRETETKKILYDKEDLNQGLILKLNQEKIDVNLFEIKNDLGVYVVVCVLNQEDYPNYAYGSAAHFEIDKAIEKSIYEAINCIAGLRYSAIVDKGLQTDLIFPDFVHDAEIELVSLYGRLEYGVEFLFEKYDIFYTYVETEVGYLVKSFCHELQVTIYKDTVPLTKRFITASDTQPLVKSNFPFL